MENLDSVVINEILKIALIVCTTFFVRDSFFNKAPKKPTIISYITQFEDGEIQFSNFYFTGVEKIDPETVSNMKYTIKVFIEKETGRSVEGVTILSILPTEE